MSSNTTAFPSITGVILAGGLARRMGGQDKGLVVFEKQPMIQHAVSAFRPQVDSLIINANRHIDQYARLGYPILSDEMQDYQGPLAGMLTAMAKANSDFILTMPCDGPYLPPVYRQRMMESLLLHQADIAVATDGERLQPVYALIPTRLKDDLTAFLATGERKIDRWYQQHNVVEVSFADYPDAFININRPEDLSAQHTVTAPRPLLGFSAFSGTGKTTLLKSLLPELNQRGIRVAVIKHAHHAFDIDKPGKDSYEIREAGAQQMLIASSKMMALMQTWSETENDPSLRYLISQIDHHLVDLILVEGFKEVPFPKIELHRPSLGKPLMCESDDHFIAVATDEPLNIKDSIKQLDINNISVMADFIEHFISDWNT